MPSMAVWLGIEPANFEAMQDGRILQEARIFPESPLISQADWFAIWDYYKDKAPAEPLPPPERSKPKMDLKGFRVHEVKLGSGVPMVSLVKVDAPRKRFYVGDAFTGMLAAINQEGKVIERARLASPPVALQTSSNALLVTVIGRFFPSDAAEGAALLFADAASGLKNEPVTLLSKLRRPTDIRAADLNGDGKPDLFVCEFGNRLGRFSWHENLGDGKYRENVLLERPGAVRSEIVDMNGDGRPDIVVLTAQAREGLFIYYGEEQGRFRVQTVVEEPPTFGCADFQIADFNGDGRPDILLANGDNGDYPTPRKAYHGIRLFLNQGEKGFKESFFYPLQGAYKAIPADFDLDGDIDIAAIAFYPDFSKGKDAESFVYLENKGNLQFEAHTFEKASAGRWMVMDAGDLDGDGDMDIVIGSFIMGPTTIAVPPALREYWKEQGASALVLENLAR